MAKLFTVSPSPHVKSSESIDKIMYWVIIAMIPALLVSIMFFGLYAIKVTLVAAVSCLLFEYLISKFLMKQEPTLKDGSALVTGILLAFNLPAGIPTWLIIVGALVAIGVGKMSFGGLGQNPFNPALVGRVFLLISFPVDMTTWPKVGEFFAPAVDGTSSATPLGVLKEGLKNGESLTDLVGQVPTHASLFMGHMGGSLGEISAAALILGGLIMIWKKVITWHIPVAVLGSMFVLEGILWGVDSASFADPIFHLFAGGAMLGAIFMATDMVSSPMSNKGQLIYGCGIGVLTICIRNFGAYPEGISFAILIMNAFTPLINSYIKPQRFGH